MSLKTGIIGAVSALGLFAAAPAHAQSFSFQAPHVSFSMQRPYGYGRPVRYGWYGYRRPAARPVYVQPVYQQPVYQQPVYQAQYPTNPDAWFVQRVNSELNQIEGAVR